MGGRGIAILNRLCVSPPRQAQELQNTIVFLMEGSMSSMQWPGLS